MPGRPAAGLTTNTPVDTERIQANANCEKLERAMGKTLRAA
jgi:hypothetical protein